MASYPVSDGTVNRHPKGGNTTHTMPAPQDTVVKKVQPTKAKGSRTSRRG
jgi:hypothetical protein